MGHIIIGHTSETSTRISVCGERGACTCRVEVAHLPDDQAPPEAIPSQTFWLKSRDARIVIREFTGLTPGATYAVTATFYSLLGRIHSVASGRFQTFPALPFD